MKAFKNGDKEGECVLRVSHKGKWKFIKFGALLTLDNSDHRVLEGFVQDITGLELKDQLIETTKERFEQFVTTTNDAIYEWDYKNKVIRWSGNVSYLLNDTDTDLHKADWWMTKIHPDDLEKNHKLLMDAMEKGSEHLEREYRFKVENGQYKLVYDQATIKYDEHQNVDKIIGSLQDIEELTNINKENKRLIETVNKVKNLIIISDKNGNIEWVNNAFLNKTQSSWKDIIGKRPWDFLNYPSTSKPAIEYMKESMMKSEFFQVELENIMKDGSVCWFHIDGSPIYDDKNNLDGYVAIESDITERKIKEEKIKKQNELLKESALINSHQVRKPLASILGLIQLMQLSESKKEIEEYLALLEICSNQLDASVKQSIDLSDNKE